jgi:hypothetical protein
MSRAAFSPATDSQSLRVKADLDPIESTVDAEHLRCRKMTALLCRAPVADVEGLNYNLVNGSAHPPAHGLVDFTPERARCRKQRFVQMSKSKSP